MPQNGSSHTNEHEEPEQPGLELTVNTQEVAM